MNENEFWTVYADSQKRVTLTEDQKRTIAAAAGQHPRERNTALSAAAEHNEQTKPAAVPPAARQRRSLGRIALPAAACLAAIALAIGLVTSFDTGGPFGIFNATPDFTVQAYAADSDSILEMGTENQIVFSRSADAHGIGSKEAYLAEGYYTGCLFRVGGEGVTRIQASVSTGALYRSTQETVTAGENPERWAELVSWKPTARGLGEYYDEYDYVSIVGSPDDLAKDDPAKQWSVELTKKLGSTIDVAMDDSSSSCSFGFWTNEDYGGNGDGMEATDAIIDLFDGATLTITATFEDGHTTTQVIELHAADVKASMQQSEDGLWELSLTPEIVDPSGLQQYTDYVHTLYGTVEKTSHEPFPESLENANEYEGTASDPLPFERQDLLRPLGDDVVIDEQDIHAATDSIPFTADMGTSFTLTDLQMLERSTQMPDGITLDDLRSGMHSWEYYNRVVSQIDGYTIDENGTITGESEGFSWVVMEATIANAGAKATEMTGDGGFYGEYAVIDDEGHVSTALARSFALTNGGWDAPNAAVYRDFTLEPGETTTVRWLAIVPDVVLDDPSLFFLAYADNTGVPSEGTLSGMELALPNE